MRKGKGGPKTWVRVPTNPQQPSPEHQPICFWPEARICPRTRTSLCLTQLSWTLGRMSSILRAEACSCSAEAVVETCKILLIIQDLY